MEKEEEDTRCVTGRSVAVTIESKRVRVLRAGVGRAVCALLGNWRCLTSIEPLAVAAKGSDVWREARALLLSARERHVVEESLRRDGLPAAVPRELVKWQESNLEACAALLHAMPTFDRADSRFVGVLAGADAHAALGEYVRPAVLVDDVVPP